LRCFNKQSGTSDELVVAKFASRESAAVAVAEASKAMLVKYVSHLITKVIY
jgi:hypothetical protein